MLETCLVIGIQTAYFLPQLLRAAVVEENFAGQATALPVVCLGGNELPHLFFRKAAAAHDAHDPCLFVGFDQQKRR